MKYLYAMVLALALAGCRTTFETAQVAVSAWAVGIDSDANMQAATNLTYAYVDGFGTAQFYLKNLVTGEIYWQWPETPMLEKAKIQKAWKVEWDEAANDGKGAPKMVEVELETAKAILRGPAVNP